MNDIYYLMGKKNHANQKLQKGITNRNIVKVNSSLDQGADINARTAGGLTPLELALSIPDNEEIVLTLIHRGADLRNIDADFVQRLPPRYIDIINAEINREEINSRNREDNLNGIGGKKTKKKKTFKRRKLINKKKTLKKRKHFKK